MTADDTERTVAENIAALTAAVDAAERAASATVTVAVTDASDGPNPVTVARELAALTMLATVVKGRADKLREQVRKWTVGDRQILTLPNPDVPDDPIRVGEIRCDNGAVSAQVSDQAAFLDWVRENAPGEVIEQQEKKLAPDKPPIELGVLLSAAFDKARVRCSGPFPELAADVIWSVLLDAGWTLAPVEVRKADIFVHPGYVNAVLAMSKKAKEPCAPQGLIPAGVTVGIDKNKPYVEVTKDRALQEGFVATLHALPLPGAVALVLED